MDDRIKEHFSTLESFITATCTPETEAKALSIVNEIDVGIVFRESPHFNKEYFKQYLKLFAKLSKKNENEYVAASHKFFEHIVTLAISHLSIDFLKICEEIFNEEKIIESIAIIVKYASIALASVSSNVQIQYLHMIQTMTLACTEHERTLLFPVVWQILGKHTETSVIAAIIETMNIPELGPATCYMSKGHAAELVPNILEKKSPQFIKSFFEALKKPTPEDFNYDISPFIKRVLASIQKGEVDAVKMLIPFLRALRLSGAEIPTDVLSPLFPAIIKELERAPVAEKADYLSAVRSGMLAGLLEYADARPFISFDHGASPALRSVSLRILIDSLETNLELARTVLPRIISENNEVTLVVLEYLPVIVEKSYSVNPEFADELVASILRASFDVRLSHSLLRAIGNLPDCITVPTDLIKGLVDRFMSMKDVVISQQVAKLMKKYHIPVQYASFDWFENPRTALNISQNWSPDFLIELLSSSMLGVSAMIDALRCLKNSLAETGGCQKVVHPILKQMHFIYSLFGGDLFQDLGGAIAEETEKAEMWMTQDVLQKLFDSTNAPLIMLPFGRMCAHLAIVYDAAAPTMTPAEAIAGIRFAKCLLSSFAEYMLPAITSMHRKFLASSDCAPLKEMESALIEAVLDEYTIPRASSHVYRLAEAFGDPRAFDRETQLMAAKYDRGLAKQFADKLTPPLEPMKTFLSLVGDPRHAEFVDRCQRDIPPENWILDMTNPEAEAELINQLPVDSITAPIHEAAIARLHLAEPKIVEERLFEYKPISTSSENPDPRIEKAPEFRKGCFTAAELVAFLYNAEQKLPADKEKSIEEYCLSSNNIEAKLGFICYASAFDYKLDEDRWCATLQKEHGDKASIAAGVLIGIRKRPFDSLSPTMRKFYESSLRALGVSLTDTRSKLYTGQPIRQFLCRTICASDPQHFDTLEGNPDRDQLMKQQLETTSTVVDSRLAFTGFVNTYFKPQMGAPIFHLPRTVEWPSILRVFAPETKSFIPPRLPKDVRAAFLAAVAKDPRFANLLPFIGVTYDELMALRSRGVPHSRRVHMFPVLALDDETYETFKVSEATRLLLVNRPPSFSKAVFRSLFSFLAPMVPQRVINEVKYLLCSVPGFAVPPRSSSLLLPDANSLPSDVARCGFKSVAKALYETLKTGSTEAIRAYELLQQSSDSELTRTLSRDMFGDPGVSYGKSETTRAFADAAAKSPRLDFVRDAFRSMSRIAPSDEIAAIVCNREFLTSHPLPSVAMAFWVCRRALAGDREFSSLFEVFCDPSVGLFADEESQQLFVERSVDNVHKLLEI